MFPAFVAKFFVEHGSKLIGAAILCALAAAGGARVSWSIANHRVVEANKVAKAQMERAVKAETDLSSMQDKYTAAVELAKLRESENRKVILDEGRRAKAEGDRRVNDVLDHARRMLDATSKASGQVHPGAVPSCTGAGRCVDLGTPTGRYLIERLGSCDKSDIQLRACQERLELIQSQRDQHVKDN